MIRLAGITGTKATITIALISLLDKDRFQIGPAGMSKLGLGEGSRIDIAANPEDGNALYIACVPNKNEGRAVSKTGKVGSEQMYSWLIDNPKGIGGQFIITDDTVEYDGIVWHKLVIFDAPVQNEDIVTEVDLASAEKIVQSNMNLAEAGEAPIVAEVEAAQEDVQASDTIEEGINEGSGEPSEDATPTPVEDSEQF
jgi:hypothetical protein